MGKRLKKKIVEKASQPPENVNCYKIIRFHV